MFFHWLFIITTLVLCAVAALPTRFWLRSGEWIKTRGLQTKQTRLQTLLAAQRQAFTPELSFLERGVGLAVDKERALVFLASSEDGGMRAAIFPRAALGGHTTRMLSDNGFQEYFVEISASDTAQPLWRLDCGDAQLAAEVDDALTRI